MMTMRSNVTALLLSLMLVSCGPVSQPGAPGPGADGGTQSERPRFEDYIRGDRFKQLVLEVDSVPGFEPRTSSQDGITAFLTPLLDKPNGITVLRHGPIDSRGSTHAWTFAELDALAKESFDAPFEGDAIKMHVLFVDGHYAEDSGNSKVLGIAWAHTHLVIFKKTIEDACRGGLTGVLADKVCEEAEQGVWAHEVGHLLGLVDNGLPMVTPHKDPEHGAHDSNSQCVMYWAWETGDVFDELRSRLTGGGSGELELDAACKADIEAVRSR